MKNPSHNKHLGVTNSPGSSKSVHLLRNFIIIMLISIILASILLAVSARQILVDSIIKSEERNNVAITQLLSNSVWPGFNEFLQAAGKLSGDDIRNHPDTNILNKYINLQVRGLNVVKIKIYNLDGLTVFSSDFSQIGNSKKEHPSFNKALKGQVISKLSFRDKIYAKKEFIQNRNIIASYIPIRIGENEKIDGVFEVYKDVTGIIEETNQTQIKIFASVFIILSILFVVLFYVIKNADKIIKAYNKSQEEATEHIRNIAFYDNLTGLPNRILFLDRLEHALQLASRNQKLVVLMFIDLDRFKQINDNLGHEAGDKLLTQVSERLLDCVRTGDTVSRISGDEFTILVESLHNIELATTIAQRVVRTIAQPFKLNNTEVFVTCSIGLSVYPFNDDDSDSLIKKADAAMFYSKSCGRNNFHYYTPDMLQHGSQRFELETELNTAIEKSQFSLSFQPKVNLSDLKMTGMEALLRWEHPERGFISPDTFIPILEETGLIQKVGEWILRESCRFTKQWLDDGNNPVCVAVNVSAIQFNQPNFLNTVDDILKETGLPSEYLELELTESCLMENVEENIAIMKALKEMGIKLAIDDFGTGYSSLSYICQLPVDILKIDRDFIRNMMEDSDKRSVVTAIISFAHGLRLHIVAEGIETLEQLTFVKAMRVTTGQGYLISKPVPANEFAEKYKSKTEFTDCIDLIDTHIS